LEHWDSELLGLGPSFGTAAVDGYFVRLFIETGFVGLSAFFVFSIAMLSQAKQTSWNFRNYFIILLGTCLFIDIGVSYKPMLLLWLWHGLNQVTEDRDDKEITKASWRQLQIRWGTYVIANLNRGLSRVSRAIH
jgi:hypothetical protein